MVLVTNKIKQMIKEDYVSIETAKLLKEKGFNEDSWFHFDSDGDIVTRGYRLNRPNEIPAWTQQTVMRWLNNTHQIFIQPDIVFNASPIAYRATIFCYGDNLKTQQDVTTDRYDSIEQAVEAAIKYCLEKLI